MRTRSQARRRRQPQVQQTSVESSNLEKLDNPPIVTMADNRTMAQLLEAPTEGYEDAIVIPENHANKTLKIKHGYSESFCGVLLRQKCLVIVKKLSKASLRHGSGMILDRKNQTPASAPVKAVDQSRAVPFQPANSGYRPR
ncbi:hypothetical protein Tco_1538634 [Tanacetum coccineum]